MNREEVMATALELVDEYEIKTESYLGFERVQLSRMEEIENRENEVYAEISEELNEHAKPKYSNDSSRKAAMKAKLADDEDHQAVVSEMNNEATELNKAKTQIRAIEMRIGIYKAFLSGTQI